MKKPLCTVLIPFDVPGVERFAMLKELGEDLGFDTFRVAQYYSSGVILEEVVRSIRDAQLIIADLSGGNPNVFYELGIAHALGKRVFVTATEPGSVSIDSDDIQVHKLDTTPDGRDRLHDELMEFQQTPGILSPIGLYTGGLAVAGQRLLGRRFGGFLIDVVMLYILAIPFLFFTVPPDLAYSLSITGILAYFSVSSTLLDGSPGQRLLGLKVIRLDRSKTTTLQNLLRPVAIAVGALTMGIGFLWTAKPPRHQALQDRITSTLVVRR